jgi:hypothetical protein
MPPPNARSPELLTPAPIPVPHSDGPAHTGPTAPTQATVLARYDAARRKHTESEAGVS